MSGRGRGRGRGFSFDTEKLGLGRNYIPPTSEPPPVFPPLRFKPVPLLTGESYDYLLALKEELRVTFKDSGYFVPPVAVKKDVQRFSDKYQQVPASDTVKWDWAYFPKELMPRTKLKRKIKKAVPVAKKVKTVEVDLTEKFNELEEKEVSGSEDEEKEEEEEELEDEEMYDEEFEEGDYGTSYFDNGEGYLDEEDDKLDEPTY